LGEFFERQGQGEKKLICAIDAQDAVELMGKFAVSPA
jgi:hypothetical protein